MEWEKGKLKDFTIRLEETTDIFVHKIGGKSYKIYFCAKNGNKIYCYRNESLPEEAKSYIEESIEYFGNNASELIYKRPSYYITDIINCYKYIDGDFIIAFYVELEEINNELLKEYFDRQIENYLLYVAPLIYHNKNFYSELMIESQISTVTKTLVEEKINYDNLCKVNLNRIKKSKYYTIIEQLSTMTYEGEYLKNKCLIFTHNMECDIEICKSFNFSEVKKVRKLLETTYIESDKNFLGLLCDIDTMKLKGLCSSNESIGHYTMIVFKDKGKWSIICDDNKLDIIRSSRYIIPSTMKTVYEAP